MPNRASYYRIKDIPGLHGLIVKGVDIAPDFVLIEEIINTNVVLGDSNLKFPMPDDAVFIHPDFLVPVENFEMKTFSTKNPFGKMRYEVHYDKGGVHVDCASYENGISVNVKDGTVSPAKTIFTENYFDEFGERAEDVIKNVMNDALDEDDLIFELKDIAADQRSLNEGKKNG